MKNLREALSVFFKNYTLYNSFHNILLLNLRFLKNKFDYNYLS